MNNKYWKEFYKKREAPIKNTDFSLFCLNWLHDNDLKQLNNLIDFGAGNLRDTMFFGKLGFKVTAVDQVTSNVISNLRINYLTSSIDKALEELNPDDFEIVYSRFFLHAINFEQIRKLLAWTQGIFMAEFRIKGDVPKIYTDHERLQIDSNLFLELMLQRSGFKILYFKVGRGMAKYKDEDPLICRIIAKK